MAELNVCKEAFDKLCEDLNSKINLKYLKQIIGCLNQVFARRQKSY